MVKPMPEPFESLSLEEQMGAVNVLNASIAERFELIDETMAGARVFLDRSIINEDVKAILEKADKLVEENIEFVRRLNQWIDQVNTRLKAARQEGEEWKNERSDC